MRIGIDVLALQSPGSRGRGVGRYGENLIAGLRGIGGHEFVTYSHEGYPGDGLPAGEDVTRRVLRGGGGRMREAVETLAVENPDGLDVLLVLHPFELCPGYDPPPRPVEGLKVVSVVHDLIPFLFPRDYLWDPPNAAWNYRRLRTLKAYDALLTNSESTRADCLRVLGMAPGRVTTIGGAADGAFFGVGGVDVGAFARFGVGRPFVFALSGDDPRKNSLGLVEAFGLLPEAVRKGHQLVIACRLREESARRLKEEAGRWGLGEGDLVLAGEVTDEELRAFYRGCAAFVFPSRYEGLGLPLIEAMHCGAAVIAGGNSSQVEVVGDAGLLVDVDDPRGVEHAMRSVLCDRLLAKRLRARGVERAKAFSWGETARRAMGVLERVVRGDARRPRARVAMVGSWPNRRTRGAEDGARLLEALRARYAVDLYHEPGVVPAAGMGSAEFGCFDRRLLERNARLMGYRAVLYQVEGEGDRGFVESVIGEVPGVVTCFGGMASGVWHEGALAIVERDFGVTGAVVARYVELIEGRGGVGRKTGANLRVDRGGAAIQAGHLLMSERTVGSYEDCKSPCPACKKGEAGESDPSRGSTLGQIHPPSPPFARGGEVVQGGSSGRDQVGLVDVLGRCQRTIVGAIEGRSA